MTRSVLVLLQVLLCSVAVNGHASGWLIGCATASEPEVRDVTVILKCTKPDGSVTFTDTNCPEETVETERFDSLPPAIVRAEDKSRNDTDIGGMISKAASDTSDEWLGRIKQQAQYWLNVAKSHFGDWRRRWSDSGGQASIKEWQDSVGDWQSPLQGKLYGELNVLDGWPGRVRTAFLLLPVYLLMSLLCFFAYRRDKLAAINDEPRTPERKLHLYELMGGWPGAWLAQHFLRHKTRKQPYRFIFWMIVLLHLTLLGDYFALNGVLLDTVGDAIQGFVR